MGRRCSRMSSRVRRPAGERRRRRRWRRPSDGSRRPGRAAARPSTRPACNLYIYGAPTPKWRETDVWRIEPLTDAEQIDDVLAIEEASFTNPWTRDMYLAELENRGVAYCYLARGDDRRVVGFCSFWRVLDELHINNIAVEPTSRRSGVATALLEHVLRE